MKPAKCFYRFSQNGKSDYWKLQQNALVPPRDFKRGVKTQQIAGLRGVPHCHTGATAQWD
jgi:hypothetical protein